MKTDTTTIDRAEEERILSLDGLAWAILGTGMGAMVLVESRSLILLLFWFAAFFCLRRRDVRFDATRATAWCAAAIPLGLLFWFVTRNGLGGYCAYLMAVQLVLIFQEDRGSAANKIYLVSFLQVMVFAHYTLELHFLFVYLIFLVAWIALSMRRQFPEEARPGRRRALLRRALRVAFLAILTLIPIWMLFPRASFTVFQGTGGPQLSGFGDEVNLGDISKILLNDSPVMRVISARAAMWRGVTLNRYTGRGWRTTFRGTSAHARRAEDETIWLPGQDESSTEDGTPQRRRSVFLPRPDDGDALLRQDVILEPLANRFLFGSADMVGVAFKQSRVLRKLDGSVIRSDVETVKKFFYTAYSRLRNPDPAVLRQARGSFKNFYTRHYQSLPPLAERLRSLAQRLVTQGKAETHYAKAEAIQRWLQRDGGYRYSLSPPPSGSMDPVEHFLFEGRRGHCELFASALAILLRMVDVPTRIVNGFREGRYNSFGGYYSVTQAEAHSWVDVYVPGQGWVEFDPTPESGAGAAGGGFEAFFGLDKSAMWMRFRAWLDAVDLQWQRKVVSYSAENQQGLMASLTRWGTRLHLAWIEWWYEGGRTHLAWAAAFLLFLLLLRLRHRFPLLRLAALLEALRRLWTLRPRWARRRRKGDPPGLYAEFRRVLERERGLIRRPGATAREFLARIHREHPELSGLAEEVVRHHERLRYEGRNEDPQKEEELKARLRAPLPPRPDTLT